MVKSIKLVSPAIVMSSRFPKIASTGRTGVSVGRQVPIEDVFKAINLITSKQALADKRSAGKASGRVEAVAVQHSAYDAINSSVNVSGDSRAKIIDNTSRQLAQIIVSQLQAANNHTATLLLPSVSASVEQLLNWADHSLKQINQQPVSLFSLNKSSSLPFFSTTSFDNAFYDSRFDRDVSSSFRKDVEFQSSSHSHSVNNLLLSGISVGSSHSLLEEFVSLFGVLSESASMSSSADHQRRFGLGSRIVSDECCKKQDKGLDVLYGETKGVNTNLGGLVEDCYGCGPLRYLQDMENGPPTSTHSSKPRELGES